MATLAIVGVFALFLFMNRTDKTPAAPHSLMPHGDPSPICGQLSGLNDSQPVRIATYGVDGTLAFFSFSAGRGTDIPTVWVDVNGKVLCTDSGADGGNCSGALPEKRTAIAIFNGVAKDARAHEFNCR